MPALVVIEGPNRGAIHSLLPERNRVGRDPEGEVLVLDERASRLHAELWVEGEAVRLRDLGSTNGTFLNGVRCGEALLQGGDELRIGAVRLLLVDDEEGAPPVSLGRSTLQLNLPARGVRPRALAVPAPATPLIGQSPALRRVERRIFKAAAVDSPVLVTGESGTGKELVARAIHRNGPRRRGPFVALNGAVLRGELLESELFGHEKGAFTGANARRQGAFELAAGGTLFLDEVGELPAATQAALLRVLEGHGFRRLGGSELIRPEVRLLAATHRDLEAACGEGSFRRDLFHRLAVLTIELPPLRERAGDVARLVEHFLPELRRRTGSPAAALSREALAALTAYPFPGNVRELKNLLERLVIFAEGERIELEDLPPALRGAAAEPGLEPGSEPALETVAGEAGEVPFPTLRELEREHVARALARTGWNKTQAARLLGIDRVTLYKRIARYGLAP